MALEFDGWATDLVRGRQWHSSQDFLELPGGSSRMQMRLNSLEEVERWVLTWGTHATVLRPKALARRLWKIGKEFVERYAMVAVEDGEEGAGAGAELPLGEGMSRRKRKKHHT